MKLVCFYILPFGGKSYILKCNFEKLFQITIFKETTTLVKELNEICYCTCKNSGT